MDAAGHFSWAHTAEKYHFDPSAEYDPLSTHADWTALQDGTYLWYENRGWDYTISGKQAGGSAKNITPKRE